MKCEYCNKELDGTYGSGRFCNRKCASGYATKEKRKEINEKVSKKLKGYKFKTILTKEQIEERSKKIKIIWAKKRKETKSFPKRKNYNDILSWTMIRQRILEEKGRKCERCGWSEINDYYNIIPVQINHKDGNNKNNNKDNLEILCPNCHSLSEHYMFFGKKHKK